MPLWTSNGSGSWLTANRWSGNSIPNAAGAVAEFTVNTEVFGIYQISIPSNTTVTIGTLNIVSSSLDGYSILSALGATNAFLRFQGVGGSPAFINVDSNGSDENNIRGTAGMGVVFASDVILTTINSDTFFEISAPISGSGDLNKYGTGTLSLRLADNSGWLGDLNLLGGRTVASGPSSLGGGNIELNNGAVLVSEGTVANRIEIGASSAIGTLAAVAGDTLTLSGQLVMASDSANAVRFGTLDDLGTIVLTGTSTVLGTGGFAIVDGTVRLGNASVAANYFSNLSALATLSVIGTLDTGGFATSIDNLDMDGGILRASSGTLNVTSTDTTNGGNSQTGTVEGTAGADRIVVNAATGFSFGGATFTNWTNGVDTITLNALGAATITGSTQNDTINGSAGNDTLNGGGGNDIIVGGGGADQMNGGAGDDFIYVDNAGDTTVEGAGGGNDRVFSSISYTLAAGQEIEKLTTNDNGGLSAINLTGNAFAQAIFGNNGSNTLTGGGGVDTLAGLGGDDFYNVDGDDLVYESVGEGNDRIFASASYSLLGGSQVEKLTTTDNFGTTAINLIGNEFGQAIFGNDGANTLVGGGGVDDLVGLGGNDFYFVDSDDFVHESAGGGNDRIFASASFALSAGSAVELLTTADNFGTAAINLTGNELAQTIYGNAGANTINGGLGADDLNGLGGIDTFAFTTALGGGNVDRINDLVSGIDRIALDDAIFTGLALGALNANAFRNGAAAGDADDRIVYNQATGALFFDADGNGAGVAVQFATLNAGQALVASDFTVI